MQDARQLDSNVASTDDGGALRELLKVEEAVRVEAVLVAGDVLRERRSTTDGNDEAVGRVLALDIGTAVRLRLGVGRDDGNRLLVDELGVARNILNAVLLDVCTAGQSEFCRRVSTTVRRTRDGLRS